MELLVKYGASIQAITEVRHDHSVICSNLTETIKLLFVLSLV